MKKRILHYVFRDIFTGDYINFMTGQMPEFDHRFIVKKEAKKFKNGIPSDKAKDLILSDNPYIYLIDADSEIWEKEEIHRDIESADQIIISGVFEKLDYWMKYSDDVWDKIYLHFWGGDFYCYSKEKYGEDVLKGRMNQKKMLVRAIERCAAVLMIVDEDYERFNAILEISKKHYGVKMPSGKEYRELIERCRNREENPACALRERPVRVVIGNSAADGNCHLEIFKKLEWLKNENVLIFCPLSYGNAKYRDTVLTAGKDIFGERFVPIMDYMKLSDYINFLSSCDVGIYYNDRQQGFENIEIMLSLRKKVYLRNGTALWKKLTEIGVKLYNADRIKEGDLEDFYQIDSAYSDQNVRIMEAFNDSVRGQWLYVLDDKINKKYNKRANDNIDLYIHVTDHCNLNCAGCSHYAPLAKPYFIELNRLAEDFEIIKKQGVEFYTSICLMGGEPLLHPNICEVMKLCREYFPYLPICLVTNGLLLNTLPETFWETCRSCEIGIEITFYPIDFDYDALCAFAKEKGVSASVYVDRRDGRFRKDVLDPIGNHNVYNNYCRCRIGGLYTQLRDGKLYRCAKIANIHILNDAFGTNFEIVEGDYLRLENIRSKDDVHDFLTSGSPFCRYCNLSGQKFLSWRQSGKEQSEWL